MCHHCLAWEFALTAFLLSSSPALLITCHFVASTSARICVCTYGACMDLMARYDNVGVVSV